MQTRSEFAREKLGLEADEKQRAVLDSESKMGILNCSRQWGKSTVAAVKAVHRAWTEAGSLVIVASPSERQSVNFCERWRNLHESCMCDRTAMVIMRCRCCFRMEVES